MFFFFFSSRRRHTRLQGDWSSDVCSSDLLVEQAGAVQVSGEITIAKVEPCRFAVTNHLVERSEALAAAPPAPVLVYPTSERVADSVEVGRNVKPPDQGIVARVADDGEGSRGNERIEASKELGGAGPARESDDTHEAPG